MLVCQPFVAFWLKAEDIHSVSFGMNIPSMSLVIASVTLLGLGASRWLTGQDQPSSIHHVPPLTSLQGGYQFLTSKIFSESDDRRMLDLFSGLRVSDVSDGMDAMGLPNVGLLDEDVAPLWMNNETFGHRFVGIAVTARYVPTQAVQRQRSESEFEYFAAEWHQNKASDSFIHLLRPGSVVVIDDPSRVESGTVNANNVLTWISRGCVGVVTNGGVRDADEIMTQRVPVYHRRPGRGIRAGRAELESVNRPVVVGGVCVMPGDIIVADGDGVALVPRVHAERVARYAQRIHEKDRENRRELYKQLARDIDRSFR